MAWEGVLLQRGLPKPRYIKMANLSQSRGLITVVIDNIFFLESSSRKICEFPKIITIKEWFCELWLKRVNWVDQWVTRDLGKNPKNCRILSVDYETAIIFDEHQCPFELEKRTIRKLAKECMSQSLGKVWNPVYYIYIR